MEESELLDKLYRKEKELHLENELLKGVPIWRLVRFNSRLNFLTLKTGYVANTSSQKGVGPRRIKLFSGFWKYLFKKKLNVLFTFNRLVKSNDGQYLDKLLDPVIEESFLKDENYVIVDPLNYVGNYPRIHKKNTVSNERRTISLKILHSFFKLTTPLVYKQKVYTVYKKIKDAYCLSDAFINEYYSFVASFLTEYYYYLAWLKILHPRRVLIVYRQSYYGLIAACKRLSIPVAEFQHGITLDKTVSYTGEYDHRIDPDYFFTFGNYWQGVNFGMTRERTICMGWAYSLYMKKQLKGCDKKDGTVLVISSPEISDEILDALFTIAQWNSQIKYHIRLHPSEKYSETQEKKLLRIPQAEVVDNTVDSAVVLPLYEYVIGENSSVLYEALSSGCRVGMLNICGLCPPIDKPGIANSFFVIDNAEKYKSFLEEKGERGKSEESFYSIFDKMKFESFLNQNM